MLHSAAYLRSKALHWMEAPACLWRMLLPGLWLLGEACRGCLQLPLPLRCCSLLVLRRPPPLLLLLLLQLLLPLLL